MTRASSHGPYKVDPRYAVPITALFDAILAKLYQTVGSQIPQTRLSDFSLSFMPGVRDLHVTYRFPETGVLSPLIVVSRDSIYEALQDGFFDVTDKNGRIVIDSRDLSDATEAIANSVYQSLQECFPSLTEPVDADD